MTKDSVLVFWSPAVHWRVDREGLHVGGLCFDKQWAKLFPRLYFLAQPGIQIDELANRFKRSGRKRVLRFLAELADKRILVSGVVPPSELFPQYQQFVDSDKQLLWDSGTAASADVLTRRTQNRVNYGGRQARFSLQVVDQMPCISDRRTVRVFDTNAQIRAADFSAIIGVFRQRKNDNYNRYYYASAGALYPIDVFVYVKEDRVECVPSGLYYYSPTQNSLIPTSDGPSVDRGMHFPGNQSVFDQSAATIFFVYDADANMPKYGGLGYFFGAVDSGIMVATMTVIAESRGIGVCSIGNMDFDRVRPHLGLKRNQVFFHAAELGLKDTGESYSTHGNTDDDQRTTSEWSSSSGFLASMRIK